MSVAVSAVPARAFSVQCPASAGVGQAFVVRLESGRPLASARLSWLGESVDLAVVRTDRGSEAKALLGVGLDDPTGDAVLVVEAVGPGGVERLVRTVAVESREFPEQRLDVDQKYVSPPKEAQERITAERKLIRAALGTRSKAQYLHGPFVRPVPGVVTSQFGLRRIFNGEPRSPHSGLDLRGSEGSPVKAFAPGRVVLTGEHYFAGNSVYLDHGQGVVSMYIHLSRIKVREGDMVEAGQVIGRVGATGRVTAAHLHFGLCVFGKAVNPLSVLDGDCAF